MVAIDTPDNLKKSFREDDEAEADIATTDDTERLEQAVDRIAPEQCKIRRIAGASTPVLFIKKLNDIEANFQTRVRAVGDYCSAAILRDRLCLQPHAFRRFTKGILDDFEAAHSTEGGKRDPEETETEKRARGRKIFDKCLHDANRRTLPGNLHIEGIGIGELHHYANGERDRSVGWHPDRETWEEL